MGGKEKKVLMITNAPNYQGSGKKPVCNESLSAKKNGKIPFTAVPPPIPMSPIVEKMEGLKAIRNRSNSLRLGRLAFYRHLEKVETMRSFWELKHVELEGGQQQVLGKEAGHKLVGGTSAMSSSLVNSLARVYDPNPLHSQKPGGRKLSFNGSDKSQSVPSSSSPSPSSSNDASLRCMENRMESLSSQMEHLLKMQQTVLTQLDSLSRDVQSMGQDLARMRQEDREGRRGSVAELCREIRGAVQKAGERVDSHSRRLDGVEKLMEGTQQVISFIGEVVKSSRLVDLLFKQSGNKSHKKVRFKNVLDFLQEKKKSPENKNPLLLVSISSLLLKRPGRLRQLHGGILAIISSGVLSL
ncbi:unnamed protein product [Tetraodon nigroviridis]|uniref:(spotted green pufferfish) hypothetical protein n=1 Tax=Tetraodon nigroviridis TaxID=99883 RepID=Q4T2K5_TETNG|nr:unnamed protein product [Tetraodon nigroviridis]